MVNQMNTPRRPKYRQANAVMVKERKTLSRRRHRGCLGSKCQKTTLPAARKMAMRKRLMSMGVVIEENPVEAAFRRRSCFASRTFERGEVAATFPISAQITDLAETSPQLDTVDLFYIV